MTAGREHPNTRGDPIETGRAVISDRFPGCLAAFIAGSFLRGKSTSTSDLDIVIVAEDPEAPYRTSFIVQGWPVEAFVHSEASCLKYFARDARRFIPSLMTMCAEGVVVVDLGGTAERIRDEAGAILERGPGPLTPHQMDTYRYALTDLVDDFVGCEDSAEGAFIAVNLAQEAANLVLLHHRRWLGRGKWVLRSLAAFDPETASLLTESLQAYLQYGHNEPLLRFAGQALDLEGGRLFDGYHQSGGR